MYVQRRPTEMHMAENQTIVNALQLIGEVGLVLKRMKPEIPIDHWR